MIILLKRRNAIIIGLASITLFTGCIAFINNADNQKKVIPESFSPASNSQFSEIVATTDQGETNFSPPIPMPTSAAKSDLPITPIQPPKEPAIVTAKVKNYSSQTPTQPIEAIPPTTAQTPIPSIKFIPPTAPQTPPPSVIVIPPTTSKNTTTRTRAS